MKFYSGSACLSGSPDVVRHFRARLSLSTSLLLTFAIFSGTGVVFAEEIPVPPGFHKMESGEVVVDDPTTAIAPSGYRINIEGRLVKEGNEVPSLNSTKKVEPIIESPAASQTASSTDMPVEEMPKAAVSSEETPQEEIPPGFHRMPNGDIMANNPAKAVAPEGYFITEGGILRKVGDNDPAHNLPDIQASGAPATIDDFGGIIPPGYHKMPDGTLMANSPSKAVAPEGYHLMPDGTLMPNGTAVEHSMHSHGGGGMLMAEYVFERMYMDGYLDSTNEVSTAELVDPTGVYRYGMAGTDMTMDMHMFMLMYHTRTYMAMLMIHYMSMEMGMVTNQNVPSTMETSGLADTIITYQQQWQYNIAWTVGLSLPTGSIDEHGDMTHGAGTVLDTKYPYAMQLGSGTYDLIFGADYEDTNNKASWGLKWEYTLRTGTNDNDYTLGDKSIIGGWFGYMLTSTLSSRFNMQLVEIGQIEGADPELVPTMSPAADAENYGGRRIDVGASIKYETAQMTSIGAELTLPVYQNLFGPQMKTEWTLGLKFGYMF